MELIDLTAPEFQGSYGNDRIEALTSPGLYKLPFRSYNPDLNGKVELEVNVVFVTDESARMQVIMVKFDDGSYQDFYYNGSEQKFKLLTEYLPDEGYFERNDSTMNCPLTFAESWEEESVECELPNEFRNLWPKPWRNPEFWNQICKGYADNHIKESDRIE